MKFAMMETVKRFLAFFLVATAIAAALNLILTPVYHDGSPDYPIWSILNWFMAAAVLVCMVEAFLQSRVPANESDGTLERVQRSALFYGAIVLTMLYFWEWFWTLNPESETGDAVTSHIVYFPIVDALFVVVSLAVGRHLWGSRGDAKSQGGVSADDSGSATT